MATLAPALPATPTDGLSDAEAERRRAAGMGNSPPLATSRTYLQIIRENVFTFINNISGGLVAELSGIGVAYRSSPGQ